MNRPTLWLSIGVAFVAGALLSYAFLPKQRSPDATPAAASTAPEVLYWYDPMYPDKHFDQPGKSPFMDMQLVPKHAGAAGAAEGTVEIDPRIAQNLGVRTGLAERGHLSEGVRATATVAFDERAASALQARVNGIVERLLVRSPLATVSRGQPLMILIAPEWTAAQEEFLALQRTSSPGLADVRAAARRRLNLLGMNESQIRAIERTGSAQTQITVVAPRDGVITELAVREGETVAAGATLARLNGIETVWANAAISEAQIARVHPGAAVRLTLAAFAGMVFDGTVDALLPTVDPVSRTQTARIVLDNPERRLTPGMVGEMRIENTGAEAAVLVPSEAVITTGTRQVVIVATGEGVFRAQEVRIGAEAAGRSEVLSGIDAGERVVLSGQFLIDSEASLTGTLARLGIDTDAGSAPSTADTPERHPTFGTLLSVDGDEWDVDTGPVPSMDMGAMRMTFRAPKADTGIAIGAAFDFAFFRNAAGDFEIDTTSIKLRRGEPRSVGEPAARKMPEQHPTFGTLLAVDGDEWDVDTGPVPSMDMGAMRMTFSAPKTDTGIATGDAFDFAFFRNAAGDFEIDATSIKKRQEKQP